MATVPQAFAPRDALLPATNFAQHKVVSGTNMPIESLAFDAATEESAFFRFPAMNYGSGNVTVTIYWYADTASSGGVAFGGSIAAITPNTDSQDIETDALATEVVATDTHLGTTGQREHSFPIVVSNLDSLAVGDDVVLKIARKVANAGDTMTGDCLVTGVLVEYSDS